jgi:hypothetical protein
MNDEIRRNLTDLGMTLTLLYDPHAPSHANDTIYAIRQLLMGGYLSVQNGSVYINIPNRQKAWLIGELNADHPDLCPQWGILPTYIWHYVNFGSHDYAMLYIELHNLKKPEVSVKVS